MAWRGLRGALDGSDLSWLFWRADASCGRRMSRDLNQLQVIGSHNSYHIAPAPAVLELIAASGRHRAEGLDYTHKPLGRAILPTGDSAG